MPEVQIQPKTASWVGPEARVGPSDTPALHVAAGEAGATDLVRPDRTLALSFVPRLPRQLCWPRHGGRKCYRRPMLAVPLRPKTQSWVGGKDGGHRHAERARQDEGRGHGRQRATVLHLVQMRAIEAGTGGELGVGPAALRQQA